MELIVLSQTTCAPCQSLKVFLKNEDIPFTEINLSLPENRHLIAQYGVMSTPVTVLEEDGDEIARVNGFDEPDDILELAENL